MTPKLHTHVISMYSQASLMVFCFNRGDLHRWYPGLWDQRLLLVDSLCCRQRGYTTVSFHWSLHSGTHTPQWPQCSHYTKQVARGSCIEKQEVPKSKNQQQQWALKILVVVTFKKEKNPNSARCASAHRVTLGLWSRISVITQRSIVFQRRLSGLPWGLFRFEKTFGWSGPSSSLFQAQTNRHFKCWRDYCDSVMFMAWLSFGTKNPPTGWG